jgi:hypothetical protein
VGGCAVRAARPRARQPAKNALQWQLGNTMLFGKDDLPNRIIEWHQRKVGWRFSSTHS